MKSSIAVLLPLIAAFSAVLPSVNAHGFITTLAVDGKSYKGNVPAGKSAASPIRQISSINPVKGATNKNLLCGQSSKEATLMADAKPGSKLTFAWGDPDGSNWPHNTGPLMTYMAACTGTCDKFDATTAKWFKIDETGRTASGDWAQQDIMNGKTYTTTVPANLKSGQYLVRHEIIALHLADTKGGAEFYPSCSQLNVQGSGTGVPSASDLVSFPGAYSDTDPGILVKNAYDAKAKYTFPGPPVVKLAAGGSSSADPSSDPSGSDSPTPSSTGSVKPSSSGKPMSTETDSTPLPSSTGTKGGNNTSSSSSSCGSDKTKRMMKKRQPVFSGDDNNTEIAITKPQPAEGHTRRLSRVMGRLGHQANSEW